MADTAVIKVTADTSQAERALGSLNNTLKGLITVSAAISMAKFADSLTNLQNKLSLVTQEGQTSADAFNVIAKSALNLGAPLSDVGDLFFRIANNTKDLSLAQTQQIAITETLIKGFQLTGQSMGETRGAIVQLGQALSQGTLRGDELNSVLEQLPMVADAIAAKFGVQRGALKALGEQGKISSKDLTDAILASGASIDKAWGQRIPTITQSFNTLQTAMGVAFNRFDQGTGVSQALSLALIKIANALVTVINFFEKWGAVIATVVEVLLIGKLWRVLDGLLVPILGLVSKFGEMKNVVIAMTAPLVNMNGMWAKFTGFLEIITGLFFPNFIAKARGVIAVIAGIASFIGITQLFDAIGGLFSKDKTEAASKYQSELDKLNKSLGLDNVEASNKAKEANKALTAEQVRNAESIRKANQSRDEELRKLMQTQQDINTLTAFQGDEYTIQSTILSTNRSLVKEILDSQGKHLGFTKEMNSAEENKLRTLLQQTEILKQQQALKALTAPESTSQVTSRAGSLFGSTQQGLDVEAKRQQVALDLLKTNKLISEQAYSDQSLLIERARTDAILALDQKVQEARLKSAGVTNDAIIGAVTTQMQMVKMMQQGGVQAVQGTLGALDTVFGAMAGQSRKAFEAHKSLATAQAIISTYQAAAMSIAAPPGPPWSFIYVAGAIAAGMAQVAAIQSQTYSGRALGGPVMGNNPYIVGERGPELFVPHTSGNITRNDQLGSGGAANINFTIQANDASGFDDLLMQRRGMITQFVRDAMQENGTRSRM